MKICFVEKNEFLGPKYVICILQKNLSSNFKPFVNTQSLQLSKRTADGGDNLNTYAPENFFIKLPIYA